MLGRSGLKVCQVTSSFPPDFIGGRETHVLNLSRGLSEQGVTVEVLTGDKYARHGSLHINNNFVVTRLPMLTVSLTGRHQNTNLKYKVLPTLPWMLLKNDANLIHAHDYYHLCSDMSAWVSKITTKPMVLTVHSRYGFFSFTKTLALLEKLYNGSTGRFTLHVPKKIIFVSKAVAREFVETGVNPSKVVIINPSIDPEEFEEVLKIGHDNFYGQKFGLSNNRIILAAGRVEKKKGFQYLVKAMPAMIAQESKIRLVIVGPDAGYFGELKKLVASMGIDQYVILGGFLSDLDLKRAMLAADVFALASEHDNFPEIALRAAVLGKPIVASDTGGIPEFIEDGQNGLLVEVGNVQHLARAILLVLNNAELARRLGEEARQSVLRKYTLKKMVAKTVSVYEEVLAEARLKKG